MKEEFSEKKRGVCLEFGPRGRFGLPAVTIVVDTKNVKRTIEAFKDYGLDLSEPEKQESV